MDYLTDVINKKKKILETYNLTEKEFGYMVYWFKNEPPLDGEEDNPVLVSKDSTKPYKGCVTGLDDDKGNATWVSNRFALGLKYARSHGAKKTEH